MKRMDNVYDESHRSPSQHSQPAAMMSPRQRQRQRQRGGKGTGTGASSISSSSTANKDESRRSRGLSDDVVVVVDDDDGGFNSNVDDGGKILYSFHSPVSSSSTTAASSSAVKAAASAPSTSCSTSCSSSSSTSISMSRESSQHNPTHHHYHHHGTMTPSRDLLRKMLHVHSNHTISTDDDDDDDDDRTADSSMIIDMEMNGVVASPSPSGSVPVPAAPMIDGGPVPRSFSPRQDSSSPKKRLSRRRQRKVHQNQQQQQRVRQKEKEAAGGTVADRDNTSDSNKDSADGGMPSESVTEETVTSSTNNAKRRDDSDDDESEYEVASLSGRIDRHRMQSIVSQQSTIASSFETSLHSYSSPTTKELRKKLSVTSIEEIGIKAKQKGHPDQDEPIASPLKKTAIDNQLIDIDDEEADIDDALNVVARQSLKNPPLFHEKQEKTPSYVRSEPPNTTAASTTTASWAVSTSNHIEAPPPLTPRTQTARKKMIFELSHQTDYTKQPSTRNLIKKKHNDNGSVSCRSTQTYNHPPLPNTAFALKYRKHSVQRHGTGEDDHPPLPPNSSEDATSPGNKPSGGTKTPPKHSPRRKSLARTKSPQLEKFRSSSQPRASKSPVERRTAIKAEDRWSPSTTRCDAIPSSPRHLSHRRVRSMSPAGKQVGRRVVMQVKQSPVRQKREPVSIPLSSSVFSPVPFAQALPRVESIGNDIPSFGDDHIMGKNTITTASLKKMVTIARVDGSSEQPGYSKIPIDPTKIVPAKAESRRVRSQSPQISRKSQQAEVVGRHSSSPKKHRSSPHKKVNLTEMNQPSPNPKNAGAKTQNKSKRRGSLDEGDTQIISPTRACPFTSTSRGSSPVRRLSPRPISKGGTKTQKRRSTSDPFESVNKLSPNERQDYIKEPVPSSPEKDSSSLSPRSTVSRRRRSVDNSHRPSSVPRKRVSLVKRKEATDTSEKSDSKAKDKKSPRQSGRASSSRLNTSHSPVRRPKRVVDPSSRRSRSKSPQKVAIVV
mmetsp:Transcript_35064/g.84843  ORF Transcript_35064/g.84843 Transcript_35064/m.84843 type:complete len:1002 (-) Transcript_35064:26-3031(-)